MHEIDGIALFSVLIALLCWVCMIAERKDLPRAFSFACAMFLFLLYPIVVVASSL